jgi:hypothetical protein
LPGKKVRATGYRLQRRAHGRGQATQGVIGHSGKQFVTVGVVPVGGAVADAGHALHIAQHNGVGSAGPGQLDRVVEQGLPQVAVVIAIAARRR